MRRTGTASTTRGGCCFLALLACICVGQRGYASDVDWSRYCVDGIQLTGNNDTRYWKADPVVDVTVNGRPLPDSARLLDSYSNTSLSWPPAESLDMTLDLRQERLISGIVIEGEAKAWRLSVSLDGQTWSDVPTQRMWPGGQAAGSLAACARYVRLRAEPGEKGIVVREIYVHGDRDASATAVGGIYPSRYPPVAGEVGELRAVVRNTTLRPIGPLRVVFEQTEPARAVLGEAVIAKLDAQAATVASIPWKPMATRPHHITVRVTGDGLSAEQATSAVLPVVRQAVYLTGFNALDNERLVHYNLYTTVGGVESYMARLRGKIALAYTPGPCVVKGESREYWESTWGDLLARPDCDGLAIDEWATISGSGWPEPGAEAALKSLRARYPGKILAPWLIGDMDARGRKTYRDADLILSELYVNLLNHDSYRYYIDRRIASMREWGFLDKLIIVLSSFMGEESTTPEQLEREIAYLRYRGPQMRGVGVYGGGWSGYSRLTDELTYRYFIAPVVMLKTPAEAAGEAARATVWNIGGMDASDVTLEAVDLAGRRLSATAIGRLKAGEQMQVTLKPPKPPAEWTVQVGAGEGCTVIQPPKRLEVLPTRQVQGGPLQIYWELQRGTDITKDRFEFLDTRDGHVAYETTNDGSWGRARGALNVSTDALAPGHYIVQMVDGKTGKPRPMRDRVEIVAQLGRFSVTAVNDRPWTGDPQIVTVAPGDTFEVAWDFGGNEVEGPAIYLSPPGEPTRAIDRGDEPYTMVKIARLRALMKTPKGEPMHAGRWTWPTVPRPVDLLENGGWLKRRSGPVDPADDSRLNITGTPGEWTLWIGTEFGPKDWLVCAPPKVHGALPITPVITVKVVP